MQELNNCKHCNSQNDPNEIQPWEQERLDSNYSLSDLQKMATQLCECHDGVVCQACWAEAELESYNDKDPDDYPANEFDEDQQSDLEMEW